MAITMLEHLPAPPAAEPCVSGLADLPGLVAEASQCVQRAGEAPVDGLADEALGSGVHETRYDLRQRPDSEWTLRPRK